MAAEREGPRSLAEALDNRVARQPSAIACVDATGSEHDLGTSRLSYQDLASRSRRLALGLQRQLTSHGASWEGVTDKPKVLGSMMRRGCDLYAVYFATARVGCVLLPLSLDHSSRSAEDQRWREARESAAPRLLVVDEPGLERWGQLAAPKPPAAAIQELLEAAGDDGVVLPRQPDLERVGDPAALLALVFTGGTTRAARCVRVTHSMVLHELQRYPEVLPLRDGNERMLQLSSPYWGAAMLGEINVPLSCGGTVVFTNRTGPELWDVARAQRVTVLGLVPELLAQIPLAEVRRGDSELRLVLAWADSCPAALAAAWRHAGIEVAELLIASEYWLSLVARGGFGPKGRPLYQPVPGVQWRVVVTPGSGGDEGAKSPRGEEGFAEAENGEGGELWLAGPQVSPGYHGPAPFEYPCAFHGGVQYLRTGDMVRSVGPAGAAATSGGGGGGLEFLGRCDFMAKAAGRWVDLVALQDSLCSVEGVLEAAVVVEPKEGMQPQAFVCLDSPSQTTAGSHSAGTQKADAATACVRDLLAAAGASFGGDGSGAGAGLGLHLIPGGEAGASLPRHPITRKVDSKRLLQLCSSLCQQANVLRTKQKARSQRHTALLVALAIAGAVCRSPRQNFVRVAGAPYIWLLGVLIEARWQASPREWLRPCALALWLPLLAPRFLVLLSAAPGLVWTLWTSRAAQWQLLFWIVGTCRLGQALTRTRASMRGTSKRACALLARSSGFCARIARPLTGGGAGRRPRPAAPQEWACYLQASEWFDGFLWYDSSGRGRHASILRGAPWIELSRALAFSPTDAMVFGGGPLPDAFTIIATARCRSPKLLVTVQSSSDDTIYCRAHSTSGDREVAFRVRDRDGGYPEALVPRSHRSYKQNAWGIAGGWDARPWRVVEADGEPCPSTEQLKQSLREGMQLLLEERTGEETILEGQDGFVAGWLGRRLGAARWNGVWQAWPDHLAGGNFHVVAVRNCPGRSSAAAFVDGTPCERCVEPAEWSQSASPDPPAIELGVNHAERPASCSHCALLELSIFEGHLTDEEVTHRSSCMAARAAAMDLQEAVVEAHHTALMAEVLETIDAAQCTWWQNRGSSWWEGEQHGGWKPPLTVESDEVDLPALGGAPVDENGEGDAAASTPLGPVGRILQRVSGRPASKQAPLAGLDSLRLVRLAGALRAELGVTIGTSSLTKASVAGMGLDALETLVQETGAAADRTVASPSTQGRQSSAGKKLEHIVWTSEGLWLAPMHWTLQAPERLDMPALRRALLRLVKQHSPLRAWGERPVVLLEEIVRWTEEAAWALEASGCCEPGAGGIWQCLREVAAWATWGCWPRYRACAPEDAEPPALLELEADDEWGALRLIGRHQHDFKPPCCFAVVHCRRAPVSFLHFGVSHALCDATSFTPLREDIVRMYLEESRGGDSAKSTAPPTDALVVLAQKFRAAKASVRLGQRVGAAADEAPSMAGWSSTAPGGTTFWGHRRMLHLRAGAGGALRQASQVLNIPVDVLLLTSLACSIARCDGAPVVCLTLTVPMRDAPGESSLVGLFSDWRNVDLQTHSLQSLLSVALQATQLLRSRQWTRGRIPDTSQRMLMNLVGLDGTDDHGFVHRPELGCMRPPLAGTRKYCRLDRPLEVQGWQTSAQEWTFAIRLHADRYPSSWAEQFARTLPCVIEQLVLDPLAPVHPRLMTPRESGGEASESMETVRSRGASCASLAGSQ